MRDCTAAKSTFCEMKRMLRKYLIKFAIKNLSILLLVFGFLPAAMALGADTPNQKLAKGIGISPKEIRGIWLSYEWWYNEKKWEQTAAVYRNMGFNTAYLTFYGSGRTFFPSDTDVNGVSETPAQYEILQRAVSILRRNGLQVVAWLEGGLSLPADHPIARQYPQYLQVCNPNVQGALRYLSSEHDGSTVFLDPNSHYARTLLVDLASEILQLPLNISEIHLDRLRYTKGANGPCQSPAGTTSAESIDGLVQNVASRIRSLGALKISAAPVGSHGYWNFLQSWHHWLTANWIDYIVIQNYIQPVNPEDCRVPDSQTLILFQRELAGNLGRVEIFSGLSTILFERFHFQDQDQQNRLNAAKSRSGLLEPIRKRMA